MGHMKCLIDTLRRGQDFAGTCGGQGFYFILSESPLPSDTFKDSWIGHNEGHFSFNYLDKTYYVAICFLGGWSQGFSSYSGETIYLPDGFGRDQVARNYFTFYNDVNPYFSERDVCVLLDKMERN